MASVTVFLTAALISLTVTAYSCSPVPASGSSEENHSQQKYQFWIGRSLRLMKNLPCDTLNFAVTEQCEQMKRRRNSEFNVYTAEPTKRGGKVFITLPDLSLDHAGEHDGIVAIDPFPEGSYGHLVFVFLVEEETDGISCESTGGNYSVSQKTCFRIAKRTRCYRNLHSMRRRHSHRETSGCELNFLPSAFDTSSSVSEETFSHREQLLKCRNLPEYAPCPALRHQNATTRSPCQSPACLRKLEKNLETRCRLFEICDHAVVIQGGWNRLVSRKQDYQLLRQTEQFLYRNHFPRSNVKLFYTNGIPDIPGTADQDGNIFPAMFKSLMRDHLTQVCAESCVETLVIFVRGPVIKGGDILLWDANSNGIAERNEIYSSSEMLEDLAGCKAKQVILLQDHSYAGFFQRSVQVDSEETSSLKVYPSTDLLGFEKNGRFTQYFLQRNHRHKCITEIYQDAIKAGLLLRDHSVEPSWLESRTIFGAPCNVTPSFSEAELSEKYFGCQNVPTLQWFQSVSSSSKHRRNRRTRTDYDRPRRIHRRVLVERNG